MKFTKDNVAIITSILSLLVAVGVMLFSIWQYRQGQVEELSLDINPYINEGAIRLTNHDLGEFGKVIQVPWQLIITNTGSRKLSVVKYRSHQVGKTGEKYNGESFYSGVDGGLYNTNGEPIIFPLILEGGDSSILNAYVGLRADPGSYEILKNKFNRQDCEMADAMVVLGRAKKDIYGNKTTLYELEDDSFHFVVDPKNKKTSTFIFEIQTGRGNQFRKIVSNS